MNALRNAPFDLNNTGRVTASIDPEAAEILFGKIDNSTVENELNYIAEIDLAHLVMMQEAGLISANDATTLVHRISDLQGSGFATIQGVPSPRGAFMLYESLLIFETGEKIGGMLQAGRSRNDLGATVLRLRLRENLAIFVRNLIDLQKALLSKAWECRAILLPVYTHYQAAQPTSLGHYFSGVAAAFDRDLETISAIFGELELCPLGAGAICGTSFPINPARTAELLGFKATSSHSIEAIASRDVVLRLLAALGVTATTLSRLSHDLQLWTTAEFGFFHIPDEMVGISSMMPQKRNVYVLENIKGMCAVPLGAFSSAAMAQHFTPFSNSIAVGTESVKPVWGALKQLADAVKLTRLIVDLAAPIEENMDARLDKGQTGATALAEWVVQRFNLPFRQVHHEVGRMVREVLVGNDDNLLVAMQRLHPEWVVNDGPPDLSPEAIVKSLAYGAGPSPEISQSEISRLSKNTERHREHLMEKRSRWASASKALRGIAGALVRPESA